MYTLADLPRHGAAVHHTRTAVVFEGTRLTYAELNGRVNRAANALIDLGLNHGERVAILSDNSLRYLETYLAAAKLGICVTPLNTRLSEAELAHIVSDSEAVAIAVGDSYESMGSALRAASPLVRLAVSLDSATNGFVSYESALAAASDEEPDSSLYPVHEDDLAVLMYTGGTTGTPKGVMLSHRNLLTGAIAAALAREMTKDDSTCFVLPIFHVSWWPILTMLLVGGKVVINRKPDLDEILGLVQDEKCTHMNLVPTIYGWLTDHAKVGSYDLSSLRSLTYAGSPFPPEVLKRAITVFGPIFSQGYGATETAGGAITMLEPEDHHLDGPDTGLMASAGRSALCAQTRVVDNNGLPVGAGQIGEICVRGEHVMVGYWKNPELTADTLRDGWYHTGDLGYLDDRGFLFLTGRKSDMIISGGENVYPSEVENVIYAHPDVLECAVFGTPDDHWGEVVHALVVLRAGAHQDPDSIINHARASLAGYKCPKRVTFTSALPTTAVGKINRKGLKDAVRP